MIWLSGLLIITSCVLISTTVIGCSMMWNFSMVLTICQENGSSLSFSVSRQSCICRKIAPRHGSGAVVNRTVEYRNSRQRRL